MFCQLQKMPLNSLSTLVIFTVVVFLGVSKSFLCSFHLTEIWIRSFVLGIGCYAFCCYDLMIQRSLLIRCKTGLKRYCSLSWFVSL